MNFAGGWASHERPGRDRVRAPRRRGGAAPSGRPFLRPDGQLARGRAHTRPASHRSHVLAREVVPVSLRLVGRTVALHRALWSTAPARASPAVLSLTFCSACAEHAADADSGGEGTEKEGGRMNKDVKIKTVMLAANLVVVAILCVFVLLTWATFNRVQEMAAEQQRLADAMQAALNARYHVVQIQQFLTDVAATAESGGFADAKHEADRAAESIKLLAENLPAFFFCV